VVGSTLQNSRNLKLQKPCFYKRSAGALLRASDSTGSFLTAMRTLVIKL